MARKWTPASQDPAELDRQFAAAQRAGTDAAAEEPRAAAAAFDARHRMLTIHLRDGLVVGVPVARLRELAGLSDEILPKVRVTGSGHGLHWDEADVHLAVPQLVADLFGRLAAQHSGRRGGKSRSDAKTLAARRNARLGGRPATRTEARHGPALLHVETSAGPRYRAVDVYLGSEYLVEPMNPAARRNRGRTGRVVGLPELHDDRRVQFRFTDTGRVGLVEAGDLVPIEDPSSAAH